MAPIAPDGQLSMSASRDVYPKVVNNMLEKLDNPPLGMEESKVHRQMSHTRRSLKVSKIYKWLMMRSGNVVSSIVTHLPKLNTGLSTAVSSSVCPSTPSIARNSPLILLDSQKCSDFFCIREPSGLHWGVGQIYANKGTACVKR